MSESSTIVMLGLPGGTLKIPAASRGSMGLLPIIGAAVACEIYDPASGRDLIPTDLYGLSQLERLVECARDDLRYGLRAIGNLMANARAEDIDGVSVVEIGTLIESLAGLDEDMLHAERLVRYTREHLQAGVAASAEVPPDAAELEAERLRFEALRAERGRP